MTRKPPRTGASPLEWRLYIASALAGVQLLAWWAVTGTSSGSRTEEPTAPTPRAERVAPVWIGDLPAGQRPAVAIPPGWRIATDPEPVAAVRPSPPRVRKAPARRRVRTRSS